MNKLYPIGILVAMLTMATVGCSQDARREEITAIDKVKVVTEELGPTYPEALFSKELLKIDITTAEADWAYLMANAQDKPYITADICIDNVLFENVALKTKGNTSLKQVVSSDSERYSLKINFKKYDKQQDCYGLDRLVLNNIFADTTYLKEYLSYALFQYMEVPSSLCTFAEVTVNGTFYGVFLALEDVNNRFLERNFGADTTVTAYKPESMQMDGGQLGVNLVYTDDQIESYSNIFNEAITKIGSKDKERLINSLKNIGKGEALEDYINVDEVLKYAAVNVFLVNLDSYLSNRGHNYCLVEDEGKLSMIPWDYNLSFGTYGLANASEAVNYPIDTVFYQVEASERPIIGKLLENETYVERYHQYLQQLCEYVNSESWANQVTGAVSLLDEAVKRDQTSFSGYEAYVTGVDTLQKFIGLRAQSVLGQLNGTVSSTKEEQEEGILVDASNINLAELGGVSVEGTERGKE